MTDPPTRTAACPRCGHDLRGVVDAWRDACPVEGTCSECGLAFGWGEIVGRLATPSWWIEQARGTERVGWRFTRSALAACVPWLLWSRLRLTTPFRPMRLLLWNAWLLPVVAIAWTLLIAVRPFLGAFASEGVSVVFWRLVAEPDRLLPALFVLRGLWDRSDFGLVALIGPLFAHLGMLAAMVLLWQTRKRHGILKRHVVRIVLVSLPWCAVVTAVATAIVFAASELSLVVPVGFSDEDSVLSGERIEAHLSYEWASDPGRRNDMGLNDEDVVLLSVFGSVLAGVCVFWWVALRRYLRIPHAFGVCLAGFVLAPLLGILALALLEVVLDTARELLAV